MLAPCAEDQLMYTSGCVGIKTRSRNSEKCFDFLVVSKGIELPEMGTYHIHLIFSP